MSGDQSSDFRGRKAAPSCHIFRHSQVTKNPACKQATVLDPENFTKHKGQTPTYDWYALTLSSFYPSPNLSQVSSGVHSEKRPNGNHVAWEVFTIIWNNLSQVSSGERSEKRPNGNHAAGKSSRSFGSFPIIWKKAKNVSAWPRMPATTMDM